MSARPAPPPADAPARSPAARPGDTGRFAGKALFLIRSLDAGGAERQLVTLARALHARGRQVVVVTFYGGGALESGLLSSGVRLRVLAKAGRWDVVPFMSRLVRLVREERPSVLHGYLTVANLLSGLLKLRFPDLRVVWGVRDSGMDFSRYDWTHHASSRVETTLSRFADVVVANSWSGREHRVANGFPADKVIVIPNGIDVERFRPDPAAGASLREEFGIAPDEVVVGIVARLDPMKGHATLLDAFATVQRTRANVRLLCVGAGQAEYAEQLKRTAGELGLADRVVWAGSRSDMVGVYNALDLLCSSSLYGEGFGNVIAEAMACGVPCVVTDVGDSARVVGEAGAVVAPGDADALAKAILGQLGRPAVADAIRRRVVEHFTVDELVEATERVLWPTD